MMAVFVGYTKKATVMVPRHGNGDGAPIADSDPRYHNEALPSGADFLALGSTQLAQV